MSKQIKYAQAEKYVEINKGDSVLKNIVLQLPTPPPLHLIDGYGLKPTENKFTRKETPLKLQLIEKRARKKVEEYNNKNSNNRGNGYLVQKYFWEIIEEEKDSLEEEIKWMKNMWYYLRFGYWFMCYDPVLKKSKAVWITPWHFFYLNLYFLAEANCWPEYRDRDRRAEIMAWYAYTATETFKDTDREGNASSMEMIDLGRRVFFGTIEPKRRRSGATARAMVHGLWIAMYTRSTRCEIIADVGKHAQDIFLEKLSPAWAHMPLWAKPVWDGDERPVKSIKLTYPKTVLSETCIESEFGYTESSSEQANDSRKLGYADHDEEGKKTARADVSTRWAINKETMAQNLIINGYTDHPSTVEEMKDGGAEYQKMFELSNFYVRKPSGQTITGLIPFFVPSPDGIDGFIDPWGWSVIDSPTKEQIQFAPKGNNYVSINIGAKESLQAELNTYLNDGSPDKLKAYRELLRKKPMDSTDCWKGSAGDIGFNIIIIDKAIVDSKYEEVICGNFKWAGGIRDTQVVWEDDKNGRWLVSDLFTNRANKWKWVLSNYIDPNTGKSVRSRAPANPLITMGGVDPYRSRTASQARSATFGENTNLSDGGISVLLNYDSSIDGDRVEEEWETHRFICTYRNRPATLDDFCEDALMTFFYYGCMCNGERNTEYMIDYFIKRGYASYLLYMMDALGNVAPQPWIFSGGINNAVKGDMINFTAQHIEKHGHKERHIDLLNEWKFLTSPDDLHTKDIAASAGWALYGYQKGYQRKYDRLSGDNTINLKGTDFDPRKI